MSANKQTPLGELIEWMDGPVWTSEMVYQSPEARAMLDLIRKKAEYLLPKERHTIEGACLGAWITQPDGEPKLSFDARYFDPILSNKAMIFLKETAEGNGSFRSNYNADLLARFAKLMLMEYWESQENK